jgi:hypothetical protein
MLNLLPSQTSADPGAANSLRESYRLYEMAKWSAVWAFEL